MELFRRTGLVKSRTDRGQEQRDYKREAKVVTDK